MKFTIQLPPTQKASTIRELLENEWLVPRKVRHFLRTRKDVSLNGEVAMFHQVATAGDTISLHLEENDYSYQEVLPGNAPNIQVLFEDEHLIIVNKALGVKTHPNQPDENDTLLNDLTAYLAPKAQRPYVVHRLDKETSGAILFAKNPFVLPILGRLLEEKQIYRRYQAVISGDLAKDCTINQKIGRDRHDRRKRIVDPRNGQVAITHVEVARHAKKQSQVYCVLDTGRTHQIRVHLKSIGHPIIGDPLYGTTPNKRLMLHAFEMYFIHPFTKEKMHVQALPSLF
ncbi:MAG: RluA family pseudouridine synthase [Enterococcus sp.]